MPVIHVDGDEGHVEVWLDTEIADFDGLCIGVGTTRIQALDDARGELAARLTDVEQHIRDEATDAKLGVEGA